MRSSLWGRFREGLTCETCRRYRRGLLMVILLWAALQLFRQFMGLG
jgi:hypothetical protein